MKNPHPTVARDAQWIAEATHFTAFCRSGPHVRRKVDNLPSRDAAEAALTAQKPEEINIVLNKLERVAGLLTAAMLDPAHGATTSEV